MGKRYQIFISSTYNDLKTERQKVIDAILEAKQIPAGMELFSAADEEQWEIIQEDINSSDFYVLIIGFRYGSVFEEGEYAGISYTEREYDYAVSNGVPVFAFILEDDALDESRMKDTDPIQVDKLIHFKEKVKRTRYVKFWKNADELAKELIQSLYKAILRGNRPGWIRSTEFNVDETLAEITRLTQRVHTLESLNADLQLQINKKPDLRIEMRPALMGDGTEFSENIEIKENHGYFHVNPVYMEDVGDKLEYKDFRGESFYADRKEVKLFRYIYQNAFPLNFYLCNDGDGKATGVTVKMFFPRELLLISSKEMSDYYEQPPLKFDEDAFKNWDARFFAPEGCEPNDKNIGENKFVPLEEMLSVPDIADLLDPAVIGGGRSIMPGIMTLSLENINHKYHEFFNEVSILPTAAGQYVIKCEIYCDELPNTIEQDILIDVM